MARTTLTAARHVRRAVHFTQHFYSARLWTRPRLKAPARASIPNSAISGRELPVAGSAVATSTGGGVTTWAIWISSPDGWIAITGALSSSTTTGSAGVLTATVTSGAISAGVKRTGVLVSLASTIALAFG